MNSTVYVVHCIDTEGPLDETTPALFERINSVFGLNLEPSEETLEDLQCCRSELVADQSVASEIARMVDPRLRDYLSSWDQIAEMLQEALSIEYRERYSDSFGRPWIYNWFCVDHVGFISNPRNRALGFHRVFDWYQETLKRTNSVYDGLHFHHHPVAFA